MPSCNPASRRMRVKRMTLAARSWTLVETLEVMPPETVCPERSEGSDLNHALRFAESERTFCSGHVISDSEIDFFMSIHARKRWVTGCPVLSAAECCCRSRRCSQQYR